MDLHKIPDTLCYLHLTILMSMAIVTLHGHQLLTLKVVTICINTNIGPLHGLTAILAKGTITDGGSVAAFLLLLNAGLRLTYLLILPPHFMSIDKNGANGHKLCMTVTVVLSMVVT